MFHPGKLFAFDNFGDLLCKNISKMISKVSITIQNIYLLCFFLYLIVVFLHFREKSGTF